MKNLRFQDAKFLTSTIETKKFPVFKDDRGHPFEEIVIVGRSNVGKSSLINHLLNKKKLALVSSKPGKTKTINFFEIDRKIILVDLPGYGFAKRPDQLKKYWEENIDLFLNTRESIKLILLLIDSRRELTFDDKCFLNWASSKNIPLGLICTKTDKLSKNIIKKNIEQIKKEITKLIIIPPSFMITYSIKEINSRKDLIFNIKKQLEDK